MVMVGGATAAYSVGDRTTTNLNLSKLGGEMGRERESSCTDALFNGPEQGQLHG